MVIALDGPAGAGKSTVARAVALALGFTYLDTGAMYRCVALRGVGVRISFSSDGRVLADGEDVSSAIRTAEVSSRASEVAADPEVRRALVAQQQQLLSAGDWVAEGRDIGTVVKPDAELKVFLTASAEERASRRATQTGQEFAAVLADQLVRDERDMNRADSPLKPAGDAISLDTTGLSEQQVVERIVVLAGRLRPA
ncbi:MAG: (d)CMP kinase [Solirubrobacterales bacterium]|nr:(d)CMP kinase [Solirubrobacterales bacterium]